MKIKYLIAAIPFLIAAGCSKAATDSGQPVNPSANKSLTLVNYGSCSELESEIKSMLKGEMEKNLENMRNYCRYEIGDPFVQPNVGVAEDGGPESTKTNLQEEGVDEDDLIKTDGNYAYAVIGSEIKIVRIWPFTEFAPVSTIKTEGAPSGIYLSEGKLIVLSGSEDRRPVPEMGCVPGGAPSKCVIPPDYEPATIEEVYDVSDPASPKLLKRNSIKAELLATRRIDKRLYLILNADGVVYPAFDYEIGIDYSKLPVCPEDGAARPSDEVLAAIERLKEKNSKLLDSLTLNELMPKAGEGKEIACTDVMRSESAVGSRLLMIYSDEFQDAGASPSKAVVLSNGGTVYASRNSLYVTSTSMPYGWWGWWTPEYEFKDSTVIHRFAIDGGAPVYQGSGEAEGHLVDNSFAGSRYSTRFSMAQFAMSEYEGYLRVATTVSNFSEGQVSTDNRVAVFDAATLSKVGEVGGMGGGEKIHAVRFVGKSGYIVTFKKTDPLYVVDLSAPESPKISGELKIPGFSTYLHPFADGYLIGVGFGADDMGDFAWTQGLKLALFDVTNSASPIEVGNREIGSRGSYSPAIEEHHAFTLDKTRGLLALPVTIYEGGGGGGDTGDYSFNGVMIFKADLSGTFDTIGQVVLDRASDDIWFHFPAAGFRTVIVGDGKDDGILTLTNFGLQLNRIDETMSHVGGI